MCRPHKGYATIVTSRCLGIAICICIISGSVHQVYGERTHCIDLARNASVQKDACPEGCCISSELRGEYGPHSLSFCGTQHECHAQNTNTENEALDGTSWVWLVACIHLVVVICRRVALAMCMQKSKQEPIIEIRKKISTNLDAEFPPIQVDQFDNSKWMAYDDEVCCVCLVGFEGTSVRKLKCSHVLHKDCFDTWCLHSSISYVNRTRSFHQSKPAESIWACPLCKHPVMGKSEQRGQNIGRLVSDVEQGQAQPSPNAFYSLGGPSEEFHPARVGFDQSGTANIEIGIQIADVEHGQSLPLAFHNPEASSEEFDPARVELYQSVPATIGANSDAENVQSPPQPGIPHNPRASSEESQPEEFASRPKKWARFALMLAICEICFVIVALLSSSEATRDKDACLVVVAFIEMVSLTNLAYLRQRLD
eukprot:gnl/MRDRNA2_/MRDRNA2_98662_c0_seq1.p1 gnl/MRDRNA2_/MRDRNA2_98662_c0~~gnl/MRDRNA2_/MRDRNA2_98662_c0_seq1.p1  ORF type:complete len:424 (-),score=56.79 gnl/MRDRNA2_/MRDRNA2_98662_c0_seq1:654-1925(-)